VVQVWSLESSEHSTSARDDRGGDAWEARLKPADAKAKEVPVAVSDQGNGTYACSYTVPKVRRAPYKPTFFLVKTIESGGAGDWKQARIRSSAVERIWHMRDIQGYIFDQGNGTSTWTHTVPKVHFRRVDFRITPLEARE